MKKFVSSIFIVLVTLAIVELSCFAFFTVFKERFTFFSTEQLVFDTNKLKRAEKVFDPGLGWKLHYDTEYGERPRATNYPTTLLATFGDSYTHCDQVKNDETYQHFLSKKLKQNVLNFGVGGYGTDQAYLRFKQDFPKVRSPLVALGLITENINRVVNVYRKFYYPKTALSLSKPRFQLTANKQLELIPNPIQSPKDIKKLSNPEFLASISTFDYWYNQDHHPKLQFPYTSILLNETLWLEALNQNEEQTIDDTDPRPWEKLWEKDDARELLFTIFDNFVVDAKAMGSTPLILLSPRKREVYRSFRGETLIERDLLLAHCQKQQYLCFDGIDALTSAAKTETDIKSFYSGHLTATGNRLFAKKLRRFLEDNNLVTLSSFSKSDKSAN